MTVAVTVVLALAVLPAGARWLRVAQREHYLAPSVTRFAVRWWRLRARNVSLAVLGVLGLALGAVWSPFGLLTAVVVVVGPVGLGLRGRTSRLALTRRLRTLAAGWIVLQGGVVAVGVVAGVPVPLAAAGALAVPVLVDAACALTSPLERALAERYVAQASARLAAVGPRIVGITGSYGKTSTKHHVVHLVGTSRALVASPASFNNRAGLARAVNEHLHDGTEVFVAEMGTYGPGEIAALCRWCPPDISVMTAIGPVHLERFGSLDRIVEAKSEILETATTVVLNVGDPRLAAVAEKLAPQRGAPAGGRAPSRRVVRCVAEVPVAPAADAGSAAGAGTAACGAGCSEVRVGIGPEGADVVVDGVVLAAGVPLAAGVHAPNVACAVAVALALNVPPEDVARRVPTIPAVANRLQASVAPSGVTVFDDTFNSNPAGARAALRALGGAGGDGRRVVVTPGMVELGDRQYEENRALGAEVARSADVLVVVGDTNRRALVRGWDEVRDRPPVTVRTRSDAVAWVRRELGHGDAVLYENDLPDHYP